MHSASYLSNRTDRTTKSVEVASRLKNIFIFRAQPQFSLSLGMGGVGSVEEVEEELEAGRVVLEAGRDRRAGSRLSFASKSKDY